MIIAAACKFLINGNEVILCGVRHGDIYKQLEALKINMNSVEELEQGFVTHKNEFLNRREAYTYASDCGQLCERLKVEKDEILSKHGVVPQLISEYLW